MTKTSCQMTETKMHKPKKGPRGPAVVEVIGLEPTTPCLQSRRSPS